MRFNCLALTVAVFFLLAIFVSAEVPQLINYQGRVSDSGGNPINGSVSLTFTVYDDSLGGVSKWSEIHSSVAVDDGLFAILLGSVNPIKDSVFNDPERYLGIQVGADPEITPRIQLVSVPWSYRVNTIDGATGGTVVGDVNIFGRANIGVGNNVAGSFAFATGFTNIASGDYSFVAGQTNFATNLGTSIGGGSYNRAEGEYAVVSGGGGSDPLKGNTAAGNQSTVGGGHGNEAGGDNSTIGGGYNNSAASGAVVSGGSYNSAIGNNSSIVGGGGNSATIDNSFVGGGNSNTASGSAAVVGGGISNIASGQQAVILGGWANAAEAMYASVGGGHQNTATGQYATVAGGRENHALGSGGTVAGGAYDTAGSYCSVAGGFHNVAVGINTAVCGGRKNYANGNASVIAGGDSNFVISNYSAIGGGSNNLVESDKGVISGGFNNTIYSGIGCFIGGGGTHPDGPLDNPSGANGANFVEGDFSIVVGGADNYVTGDFYNSILGGERNLIFGSANSWIGGGLRNRIYDAGFHSPIYSVICGGELNKMIGSYSFCGTGFDNDVFGDASAIVSGGYLTQYDMGIDRWVFINQIDTNATYSFIGTGWGNRASDSCSLVLGGVHNYARGKFSIVVGGGADFDPLITGPFVTEDSNSAQGDYSVILGGRGHVAGGFASAVGGGSYNRATGDYSVISGGGGDNVSDANTASGTGSTIGGGARNTASGNFATIPGGYDCEASQSFSTAMGRYAMALHTGSFTWSDASASTFTSTNNNQFNIRAAGGTRIFTNSSATTGVQLIPGAGSWSNASDSTLKRNIREVDYLAVLEKLTDLPISRWSYNSQDENIEHIGPMAQDFYELFGVGDNNKTISTIDPDGIALASIKALVQEIEVLKQRISELEEKENISR